MKQHGILPGIVRPLVAVGLFGFAAMASAQTSSTTMNVSSTLSASCSVAATAMSFGAEVPSPMVADVDATATITATCSNGRTYTIGMNAGSNVADGATEAIRKLRGSSGTIDYAVYSNSGRTSVWGTGSSAVSATGNGLAQPLTAYGRMPRQATAGPGTYVDSVTVTITF
jgi:spore coat protein U-like protein